MPNNNSIEPILAPRLYMVVICVAFPNLTTEVQFLNFPMVALCPEEAVKQIQLLFTVRAYDPETDSWNLGGVPCNPWHIFAVDYPKDLENKIAEELGVSLAPHTSGDEGVNKTSPMEMVAKIVQLFPQKAPKPDDENPPDDPPNTR